MTHKKSNMQVFDLDIKAAGVKYLVIDNCPWQTRVNNLDIGDITITTTLLFH